MRALTQDEISRIDDMYDRIQTAYATLGTLVGSQRKALQASDIQSMAMLDASIVSLLVLSSRAWEQIQRTLAEPLKEQPEPQPITEVLQ